MPINYLTKKFLENYDTMNEDYASRRKSSLMPEEAIIQFLNKMTSHSNFTIPINEYKEFLDQFTNISNKVKYEHYSFLNNK